MISSREAELLARRAALKERIAHERQRLATAARPLEVACARVDEVRAALAKALALGRQWLGRHPVWVAAGLAVLFAARPRRVLRWAGRLFALWRLLVRVRRYAASFTGDART